MTPFEIDLVQHLETRVAGLSPRAAGIVRSAWCQGQADPDAALTERQVAALVAIGHRFRRQLPERLLPAILLFHFDYLAAQESAGGGALLEQRKPRAEDSHDQSRPTHGHPATPAGAGDIEGLPLWSRVSDTNELRR